MFVSMEMISAINQMNSFIHLLEVHVSLKLSIRAGCDKRGGGAGQMTKDFIRLDSIVTHIAKSMWKEYVIKVYGKQQ